MFISSKHSRKRYFHHADCGYAKRISNKNRLEFASVEEARKNGYKLCPHCCVIGRQYKNDRKAIEEYCMKNNLTHYIREGEMYVISADDTAWRICGLDDKGKGKYLLHESKNHVPYHRKSTPYDVRDYHLQRIPSTSILGYISYILEHDQYEKRRTEQIQLERALRQEEIRSIKAVQRQIGRQNRKKRGCMEDYTQKRRRSKQQLRALAASFSDYRSAQAAYI